MTDLAAKITINKDEMKLVMDLLSGVKNGAKVAISHALNKTASYGKTKLVRRLSVDMTARRAAVAKRIRVVKATRANLHAEIVIVGGQGLSLASFSPKDMKRGGVSVRIAGQRIKFHNAFMGRDPFKKTWQVYQRTGGEKVAPKRGRYANRLITRGPRKGQPLLREPLESLKGPSVAGVYEQNHTLAAEVMGDLSKQLSVNLNHEVKWLLGRGTTADLAMGMNKGGKMPDGGGT